MPSRDPEVRRAAVRRYQSRNRERVKAWKRASWERTGEAARARRRDRYAADPGHRERILAQNTAGRRRRLSKEAVLAPSVDRFGAVLPTPIGKRIPEALAGAPATTCPRCGGGEMRPVGVRALRCPGCGWWAEARRAA